MRSRVRHSSFSNLTRILRLHFPLSNQQGAGLVVLAGCYVAVQQVFTKNVLGDTKKLFITLIGAGRGSMYNVSFV